MLYQYIHKVGTFPGSKQGFELSLNPTERILL